MTGFRKETFMKKEKRLNKSLIVKLLTLIVFFIVAVGVTIWIYPYIVQLGDPAVQESYKQEIESLGWGGFLVMLGIQVVQVVFAIIPGEPVEIIACLLYGGIGGLLLCLIGVFIGTIIIYYLVKLFGKPLVDCFVSPERFEKMKFLHDERRVEWLTLILFLIPGTPKDLMTYIAPLTPIRASRFFVISTIGRLPAILTATFAGAAIYEGNYWFTFLLFAIATGLTIVGIVVQRFITMHFQKKRNKKTGTGNSMDENDIESNSSE